MGYADTKYEKLNKPIYMLMYHGFILSERVFIERETNFKTYYRDTMGKRLRLDRARTMNIEKEELAKTTYGYSKLAYHPFSEEDKQKFYQEILEDCDKRIAKAERELNVMKNNKAMIEISIKIQNERGK